MVCSNFLIYLAGFWGFGAPAEAVRRVQSEFRSQPRIDGWKDPYYWAGWQYSAPPDHLK